MTGSMIPFVTDGQTDGQTDEPGYIGPLCGSSSSSKIFYMGCLGATLAKRAYLDP